MKTTLSPKIAIFATFVLLTGVALAWADGGSPAAPAYGESPGKIYVLGTGARSAGGADPSGRPNGQALTVNGPAYGGSPGKIYVLGTAQRAADQVAVVYAKGHDESPGRIYVSGNR